MITDISLCSDPQGFIYCDSCKRNPDIDDIPDDDWQSWIDPRIKDNECLDFKELLEGV